MGEELLAGLQTLFNRENETLRDIFDTDNISLRGFNFFGKLRQHKDQNVSSVIILIVSFSILVVISIFGNILVCNVILKNRKLHTVTNMFIANMAFSDLLMVILNVPLNIARHLMYEWSLGTVLCHLLTLSLMVSVYVSTFTLTAIALDRQRVLIYPLNPRITRRKGFVILGFIWLLAISLAMPFGVYTTVEDLDLFITKIKRCQTAYPHPSQKWEQYLTIITILLQYVIPLTVIAVTYMRIVHKLWLRTHLGVVTERQRAIQIQAKRKSIKLLVAVVVVFAVCWMPLNLYHVLTDFHPNTKLFQYNSTVFFICHWVAISSSCINPFLYCWMNPTFREELRSRCRCFSRVSQRNLDLEFDELMLPNGSNMMSLRYRTYRTTSQFSSMRSGSLSSAERFSKYSRDS